MQEDSGIEQGFETVDTGCIAQHEWYSGLRRAGFTRLEGLYIITRPSVEMARLSWHAQNDAEGGEAA